SGTDEKVLSLFKVFGGGIVELLLAIGTEYQSRKRTALACCRSPVSLLTNLLHLVKDFLLDNGRMGVVENHSIFFGIFPLLFVPNGIGVGLEIDRCANVLFSFKNTDNGTFVPAVRVLRLGVRCFHALLVFVCGRCEYLVLFKLVCNLARSTPIHAERENLLDHLCSFLVNNPFLWIFG